MYLLPIEVLIEVDIALNLTAMLTIILTRIATWYSTLIVTQIDAPNFRNLFRIESVTRTVIEGFA